MSGDAVLITGGAGFIGCGLSARLAAAGAKVLVVDVLHPQVHEQRGRPSRLPDSVELVPFDVTEASAWDALLRLHRPRTVVHLAAETGTGQSLREATRHASVNVVGTTQMLDAMVRAGHVPNHLVLASSRAVYGEGAWTAAGMTYYPHVRSHEELTAGRWDPPSPTGTAGVPLASRAGETHERPTNVYAATKLAQEHICSAWTSAMAAKLTILRFQNVYGVGQSLTNGYTGVLTLFARRAVAGKVIPLFEDGKIIRDFVYVDDVVDSLAASIERPPDVMRRLDIGSGRASTLADVAAILAEAAGGPPPKVTGEFRDGDVRAASCDIAAAARELGYTPQWSLSDGLAALVDWARYNVRVAAA